MSVKFLVVTNGFLYEALVSGNGSPSKLKNSKTKVDLSDLIIVDNAVLSKSSDDSLLDDALKIAKQNNADYILPNTENFAVLYLKKKNNNPVDNKPYTAPSDVWWPPEN